MTCGNGQPCGHYLRQFGVSGNEGLAIYANRDPNNRGNTYPDPLFGVNPNNFTQDDLGAWDCNNSGVHGPQGDQPSGSPACWLAPRPSRFLRNQKQKFPHLLQAKYPGT
jgi:hypothetical protein